MKGKTGIQVTVECGFEGERQLPASVKASQAGFTASRCICCIQQRKLNPVDHEVNRYMLARVIFRLCAHLRRHTIEIMVVAYREINPAIKGSNDSAEMPAYVRRFASGSRQAAKWAAVAAMADRVVR